LFGREILKELGEHTMNTMNEKEFLDWLKIPVLEELSGEFSMVRLGVAERRTAELLEWDL
jgi:hypothetical protein